MVIEYLNSEKNKMVFNGYKYTIHAKNKNSIRWKCASCASVYVTTSNDEVIHETKDKHHKPNTNK